jgi:hypothetical protein
VRGRTHPAFDPPPEQKKDLCPKCKSYRGDVRKALPCCNDRCNGQWGTNCYHCHHSRFLKEEVQPDPEIDLHANAMNSLRHVIDGMEIPPGDEDRFLESAANVLREFMDATSKRSHARLRFRNALNVFRDAATELETAWSLLHTDDDPGGDFGYPMHCDLGEFVGMVIEWDQKLLEKFKPWDRMDGVIS